jgi:hypothetical protein
MGYKQKMTYKQRLKLSALQYKRMLEEKRGHNYEYWNEEKHNLLLRNGWKLADFSPPVIEPAGFFFIAFPQRGYSLESRNIFHSILTADLPSLSILRPLDGLSLSKL